MFESTKYPKTFTIIVFALIIAFCVGIGGIVQQKTVEIPSISIGKVVPPVSSVLDVSSYKDIETRFSVFDKLSDRDVGRCSSASGLLFIYTAAINYGKQKDSIMQELSGRIKYVSDLAVWKKWIDGAFQVRRIPAEYAHKFFIFCIR